MDRRDSNRVTYGLVRWIGRIHPIEQEGEEELCKSLSAMGSKVWT